MKTSELMSNLQAVLELYGDLEVGLVENEQGSIEPLDTVKMQTREQCRHDARADLGDRFVVLDW